MCVCLIHVYCYPPLCQGTDPLHWTLGRDIPWTRQEPHTGAATSCLARVRMGGVGWREQARNGGKLKGVSKICEIEWRLGEENQNKGGRNRVSLKGNDRWNKIMSYILDKLYFLALYFILYDVHVCYFTAALLQRGVICLCLAAIHQECSAEKTLKHLLLLWRPSVWWHMTTPTRCRKCIGVMLGELLSFMRIVFVMLDQWSAGHQRNF